MTICPIAIAVGCQKCPAFSICPLKRVLGDAPKVEPVAAKTRQKTPIKSAKKKTAKTTRR